MWRDLMMLLKEPMPVLTQDDMNMLKNLDSKLDNVVALLESQQNEVRPDVTPAPQNDGFDDLSNQVRKLAKTQFKANTLQETQLQQQQETFEQLQTLVETRTAELEANYQQATETMNRELFKNLLPVMDSLDAAFDIGKRQVLKLPLTPEVQKPIIAWLDGLRLARMRLTDLFKANGVEVMKVTGKPFDPHRQIAVGTDNSGRVPDGYVLKEERRGYMMNKKLLREAEVIVSKSK